MIGPRSTTLLQPIRNNFDLIPGITGDLYGNSIVAANRNRVVCVRNVRVAYAVGDECRVAEVVSHRFVKAPPLEDRMAKVPSLPPRIAKLPNEEKC